MTTFAPASSPARGTSSTLPPRPPLTGGYAMRRFTVGEYHRMIREGFFDRDNRLELLDGYIVTKMPHDPIHDAAVAHVRKLLAGLLPEGWHVRVQSAITLTTSEPEPDLAIVAGDELNYASRHPVPADLALVVEVANTSLAEDRDWKSKLYAADGVAIYWIVDLVHAKLEVHSNPSGASSDAGYRSRQVLSLGESVELTVGDAATSIVVDAAIPAQLRGKAS